MGESELVVGHFSFCPKSTQVVPGDESSSKPQVRTQIRVMGWGGGGVCKCSIKVTEIVLVNLC